MSRRRVLVLVDRLCAVSPVVLVVDDMQWADEVSVSVWHRPAGAVGQVPLLVVGALDQHARAGNRPSAAAA